MSKAYKLARLDRAAESPLLEKLQVGSVVFGYGYNTYGVASEDSRLTGIEHIAVALEPNDAEAQWFTIPFEDLTPVIHHVMVGELTKSPVDIVASLIMPEGEGVKALETNLLHMAVGLADEYFEYRLAVTPENKLEELGDLLFYTEGLLLFFPVDRATIHATPVATGRIEQSLQLVFQTIKRCSLYEKPLATANLVRAYQGLMAWIESEAISCGFPGGLEAVREANIDKLGVRYRDFVYSNQAAHERADKKGTDEEECPECGEVGPEHNSRCSQGKAPR